MIKDITNKELFYKGKEALMKMDYDEAKRFFSQSIKEEKYNKSIEYILYANLLTSDYKSISHIISMNYPLTGFSLYTLYWYKLMTGELDEINDILEKMLEENNYFLRVFAIKEFANRGKYDNVKEIIQQKIKFFGLSYELHLEEQRASLFLDYLYERNHLAILQGKSLLKEYPNNGDVYLDFMEIIFKTANISYIKDILNTESIKKQASLDYRLMYLLSRELYLLNEFDRSKELLINLIFYFKHNPIFHYNLGNIYFFKNNYLKAVDEYEMAISCAPLFERAFYNLGIAYFKLGDLTKAIKNLGRAVEIAKKPDAIYNLSVCLIEKKELQDAYYYLNKIPSGYAGKFSPHTIKEQIKELVVFT
jgi:tetratricopeptide (TPR) repeat protein